MKSSLLLPGSGIRTKTKNIRDMTPAIVEIFDDSQSRLTKLPTVGNTLKSTKFPLCLNYFG